MATDLTNEDIGGIGLCLYSIIFFIALQRIYVHFIPYSPPIYSTRKILHILIALYGLLQSLSYTSFLQGSGTYYKWTYCLHLISIFLELAAFSVISILWSKTLMSRNHAKRYIIPFLFVVNISFLLYTLYLIAEMSLTNLSFENWTKSSILFRGILIVEPTILIINAFLISFLGIRITLKLVDHPSWTVIESSDKKSIILRFLGTVTICCLSYLMRASLELIVLVNSNIVFTNTQWWVLSTWLPTSLPIIILMYTMRRTSTKKRVISIGSDNNIGISPMNRGNYSYDKSNLESVQSMDESKIQTTGPEHTYSFMMYEDDDYDDQGASGNLLSVSERLDARLLYLTSTDETSKYPSSPKHSGNNGNNRVNRAGIDDFFKGAPELSPNLYRKSSNSVDA